MKITNIQTSNFLGARAVDLQLTKPVALIAGKNYAGKSSLQEAVRMALTGEPVRVIHKKDYAALLSEGAEAGFADVTTDQSRYSIVLPGGKGVHCETAALPYVLDAQRFTELDDNARRSFLFGLMGVKMDGDNIRRRLIDRLFGKSQMLDADVKRIDMVTPLLRAGFDAASKEAASKARDAKASWKTVTGGETWGKDKAAKWAPPAVDCTKEDAEKALVGIRAVITADDADIAGLQQEIGAGKAEITRRQSAEARRLDLHTKSEQIGRIQARLDHDEAELAGWEQKVADCRAAAGVAQPDPKAPGEFLLRGLATVTGEFLALSSDFPEVAWPAELINRAAAHHAEYVKLHGDPVGHDAAPDQDAAAKLPEYENALKLMQRAVANGKRDLEAAKAAKAEYDRIVAEQSEPLPDVAAKEKTLREITQRRDQYREEERQTIERARVAAGRDKQIADAAKHHADVMEWTDIADALSPDGIPAELLAEALGPINSRLAVSAESAQWPVVKIGSDMVITYGGRTRNLLSKSEKWREDAMIAESVSHISGVKLLVLDEFDILDMTGREDALYWLDGLAQDGDIDTALVFGTLKAIPAQLLPSMEGFWIENGTTASLKAAA